MASRLASLALRFPRLCLALIALVSVAAATGTPRLHSVSYLEGSLPGDDRELTRYRELQREFGSDRLVVLVFGCDAPRPCESIFEPEALALIRDLTVLGEDTPGVEAVDSLGTAGVLVGEGAALTAERMPQRLDAASIASFRAAVENDPILPGQLVSRDYRTTAIAVRFDPAVGDADRNEVARRLIAAATRMADEAGFELYLSGDVSFTAVTDGYVRSDLAALTPVMFVLLAGFLLVVFRDGLSVLLALATVGIPALWVFGLMGWLGRPISPMTSVLPILILVVGVTDAVHFLVRVFDLRGTRSEVREVVLRVADEVGPPTSMTALTSALGFLSLLTGRIPSIQDFGLFAAIGIAAAWVLTFSLIPISVAFLRMRLRPQPPPAFTIGSRVLDEIRVFALRRATPVLVVAALLSAVSLYGVSWIGPENDSLKMIGPRDLLAESVTFLEARMRPAASIEVSFEPSGDLLAPETLARLEAAEALLARESDGAPVASLLPVLRVAHREITDRGLEVPASRAAAGQLLLMAELADAGGVRRYVTADHRLTRLSGSYRVAAGPTVRADLERIRQGLAEIFEGAGDWAVTGSVFLATHIGDLTLDTQISSFSTAFGTIFVVIVLFVRSLGLGALGMIPNVFPVLVTLGFMGIAQINLDVATAMIASILLGISVDDTYYFMVHFQKARRAGEPVDAAIAFTFSVAGKPALFCTAILALGFFVLGFSRFQSLAIFGLLSGFAVLLAVIAELFLMPAVLERTVGRRERHGAAPTQSAPRTG